MKDLGEIQIMANIKPIENYPNYTISEDGIIKNTLTEWGKLRDVSHSINSNGYPCVHLRNGRTARTILLHRLLAAAFIPNPNNYPQVNHKNGIKDDYRLCNLEWCTAKMNIRHAIEVLSVIPKPALDINRVKYKKGNELAYIKRMKPIIRIYPNGESVEYLGVKQAAIVIINEGLSEASRIGALESSIRLAARGGKKSCFGCKWAYKAQ